jgi:hypothetical protein
MSCVVRVCALIITPEAETQTMRRLSNRCSNKMLVKTP